MGIDKRKLPECPKDDTCVAYDDASWRSEGWVLLVIGILMFLGGPLCLCCIKKVRKKVLKCFGACCSSFGECCSFLACAPCKCFLTCGSACGSCCAMLFPHEESGSNVDEDEYYKALRTYEDRHKLLLERVEEEKEDPPATLSVNIKPQNGTTATLAAYKSSTVSNICRQLGVDSFTFADQECSAQKAVGACTPNSSLQSLGVCDGASLRVQALPTSRSWFSPQKRRWNWLISMLLLKRMITSTHTLTHSVVAAPTEPMIHSTEVRKLSSRWIPTMTVWSIKKSLQPQVAQRQISIVMI